jgi:hypothetical protein
MARGSWSLHCTSTSLCRPKRFPIRSLQKRRRRRLSLPHSHQTRHYFRRRRWSGGVNHSVLFLTFRRTPGGGKNSGRNVWPIDEGDKDRGAWLPGGHLHVATRGSSSCGARESSRLFSQSQPGNGMRHQLPPSASRPPEAKFHAGRWTGCDKWRQVVGRGRPRTVRSDCRVAASLCSHFPDSSAPVSGQGGPSGVLKL